MRNLPKIQILTLTVVAAAELARGTAISINGTTTSAGEAMHGVADTKAYIGDELAVDVLGTTSCVAGAAIAQGALIEVGTDGKFITQSAGKAVGRAMTAASGDNAEFVALLIPSNE